MLSYSMRVLVSARSSRFILSRGFAEAARVTGSVKWFDTKKGYGFINLHDSYDDVFVHHSQIQSDGFRTLLDGEEVEFEVVIDESKGNKKTAAKVTGPNGAILSPSRLPRREDVRN